MGGFPDLNQEAVGTDSASGRPSPAFPSLPSPSLLCTLASAEQPVCRKTSNCIQPQAPRQRSGSPSASPRCWAQRQPHPLLCSPSPPAPSLKIQIPFRLNKHLLACRAPPSRFGSSHREQGRQSLRPPEALSRGGEIDSSRTRINMGSSLMCKASPPLSLSWRLPGLPPALVPCVSYHWAALPRESAHTANISASNAIIPPPLPGPVTFTTAHQQPQHHPGALPCLTSFI